MKYIMFKPSLTCFLPEINALVMYCLDQCHFLLCPSVITLKAPHFCSNLWCQNVCLALLGRVPFLTSLVCFPLRCRPLVLTSRDLYGFVPAIFPPSYLVMTFHRPCGAFLWPCWLPLVPETAAHNMYAMPPHLFYDAVGTLESAWSGIELRIAYSFPLFFSLNLDFIPSCPSAVSLFLKQMFKFL